MHACEHCRRVTQQQCLHLDTPACPGRGRAAAGAAHCCPAPGPGRPASHGHCSCLIQQVQNPSLRLLLGTEAPVMIPSSVNFFFRWSPRPPTDPLPPRLPRITGRLTPVTLPFCPTGYTLDHHKQRCKESLLTCNQAVAFDACSEFPEARSCPVDQ